MAYLKHIEYNEGVNVARGLVRGAYSVNKFGYNPSVPSNAFETAWDGSNLYTYISTPGTATITSSNAGDNGGTGGASGSNDAASGSVVFKRVFRAVMITATTGTANVGTITVTVDSKSAAIISIGYGQSLMALYTVPADHTAYLMQIDASSQKDLENQIQLVVRNGTSGHVWQTKEFLSVRGGFNSKEYRLPVKINQKHDIEVRVKSSATSAVSAGFELLVIQDTFVESRRA